MKVAELMKRNAEACSPQDSLNVPAKIMWEKDCGFVPVVAERNSKVVGVLTDRDICMAAYTQGLPLRAMQVESAMALTVVSCAPDDDVSTAEQLMRENKVHRLPVIGGDGKLGGILSLTDIVRQAGQRTGAGDELSGREIVATVAAISQPRGHITAHVVFGPEEGELEFVPGPPPKRGQNHK
jgi:CBS domain-containing protein